MFIQTQSFSPDGLIPAEFAFAKSDPETHATLSDNRSPHLAWGDAPDGTRSFAVTCIDEDAPTVGDDVNAEGRTVAADLPRAEFAHWLMIDIPVDVSEIAAGACSDGVTPGGKQAPSGPVGSRQGLNDYTGWFSGDAEMGGSYLGYDGPAPPWNDERMHRYHFEVIALDVERLDVGEAFTLQDLRATWNGHILGRARTTGRYTQNPALMGED